MHPYLGSWQYGYTLGPSSAASNGQYTVFNQTNNNNAIDQNNVSKSSENQSQVSPAFRPKVFVAARGGGSSSSSKEENNGSTLSRLEALANRQGLSCDFSVTKATSSSFEAKLRLGEEQYLGRGNTETSAKNNACLQALSSTSYVFKTSMRARPSNSTPTSQLYEMAAKSKVNVKFAFLWPENFKFDQNAKNWSKQEMRAFYRVQVTVGEGQDSKTFVAESDLPQQAKHNASIMAMPYLRSLENKSKETVAISVTEGSSSDNNSNDFIGDKNPIMTLNELAQAKSLPLEWIFESDSGPAHMREFKWSVRLGSQMSSGSGSSKKVAKTNAAIALLKTLPPEVKTIKPNKKRKIPQFQKHHAPNKVMSVSETKPSNVIGPQLVPSTSSSTASTKTNSLEGQLVQKVITAPNPISALFEYSRKARIAEPDFVCVSETVLESKQVGSMTYRKMDYTMKLDIGGKVYFANAGSKKEAKTKVASEAWNVVRASTF